MNLGSTATRSPAISSVSSFATFYATARHEPIYVILGVQGSGTNLLRSILVGAFNFSVIQDQSIVFNAARKLGPSPSAAAVRAQFEYIRSRLFPSAVTRKTSRRIKTNASFAGIDEQFDASRISSGAEFAHFVYAYGAFARGTSLMAIKSDDLWETIEAIDAVLPKRRIILLTRDFRDNLLSITNKDFGPRQPLVAAQYVKQRFAYYDAEYRRTPPTERFHVRYEDLLEAPDVFVTRFGHHFGLGGDGCELPAVNRSRIRSDNTKKWGRLTPQQLAYCEAILRDELQEYGYGIETAPGDPPGAGTWLAARTEDVIRRVPQKLGSVVRRLGK